MPDIVVANAGFGVVGNAQNLTLDDYRRQFETNVFGVLRTFHETLDSLRRDTRAASWSWAASRDICRGRVARRTR